MSDRFLALMVSGALGFAVVGCSESSPPANGAPAAGSSSGGSGGDGGSTSAGTGGGGGDAGSMSTAGDGGTSAGSGGSGDGGSGGSGGSGGGGGSGGASPHGKAMSFFVTSQPLNGTGKLGGLAGADAHCAALATAAGAVRTQWVAYLSAAEGNVAAKSRIGAGPWYNYDEDVFAADDAALHALPAIVMGDAASRTAYIAAKPADALFMDENGNSVPSNVHDILTGSNPDGTLATGKTCSDWTSDSPDGVAALGHSDTPGNMNFSPSWNAAHDSQGCDAGSLNQTGGEGRIYCFATD